MSVGSGIAASLGIVAESTYGDYVAPTRWLEINSADLKKLKNTQQGRGLAAGRLAPHGGRRVVTTKGGAGTVQAEVQNKQMGLLLAHLMGGTPTVVQQGATAAYLQTHTLADPVGKYLTAQVGVPDTAGTVRPYSFLGTKVLGAEFSSEIDGLLMASWNLDSQDVTEAETLAAPSYPTGLKPFHGVELTVKVGSSYGAEAEVNGVTGVSCSIQRGQKTDRFYAGQDGLKAEPLLNDFAEISGTLNADFLDKTVFADRFASDEGFSLVLEWVGPVIASTFFETFRIKLPYCFLEGETPTVNGPDVINTPFNFVARYDGTNAAAIIEYMSVDTAI